MIAKNPMFPFRHSEEPRLPPFQRRSPTSIEAAESVRHGAHAMAEQVLAFLEKQGRIGATDEEGVSALGMPANTYRPRRCELVAAGVVMDSETTRIGRSGRKATVWRVK